MGVFESPVKQKIVFNAGWNIFSANNTPDFANLIDVFESMRDNSALVKIMNEEGNTYEDYGIYGGWKK